MAPLGGAGHWALIEQVIDKYRDDGRIRAIAVFGSVGAGTWHELSDVDLDVVTADGVVVEPRAEAVALFGSRAVVILCRADSVDVVLDGLGEISIRWHPLATTSPNIIASAQVVAGELDTADIVAAGDANRKHPDVQQLLDAFTRDAVSAWKSIQRARNWDAVSAVQRMRQSLVALRGRRDCLRLDPADPPGALAAVISEAASSVDFGLRRTMLLDRLGCAPLTPVRGSPATPQNDHTG